MNKDRGFGIFIFVVFCIGLMLIMIPSMSEQKVNNSVAELQQMTLATTTKISEDVTTEMSSEKKSSVAHDWNKLQEYNDDIVAWISIPKNDIIDYPIVDGGSTYNYLRRDYKGNHNSYGSIFVDNSEFKNFKVPVSIVYGHNMRNNKMFGTLKNYNNEKYLKEHNIINIELPTGEKQYEVFAYAVVKADDEMIYSAKPSSIEDYVKYVQGVASVFQQPSKEKEILVLSTCTNASDDNRSVVIATRIK